SSGIPTSNSEPHILHASTIHGQVFPRVEPIEMLNGHALDRTGLGQAQVDGNATPPVLIDSESAPVGEAAAFGATVKAERIAADDCLGRARDAHVFTCVAISPQRAVAAAGAAIACGSQFRKVVIVP